MKQTIDNASYEALSPSAQLYLRTWTIQHGYAMMDEFAGYIFEPSEPSDHYKQWWNWPRLSIGQMLEFLDGYRAQVDDWERWSFFLHTQDRILWWGREGDEFHYEYADGEVCDALWAAVKSVLAKEEHAATAL